MDLLILLLRFNVSIRFKLTQLFKEIVLKIKIFLRFFLKFFIPQNSNERSDQKVLQFPQDQMCDHFIQSQFLFSGQSKTMTLHTKWLNFNFEAPFCRVSRTPHLQQIVRTSQEHQIKQHENALHLSPQKALIRTTKKILNIKKAADNPNLTISHFSDSLNEQQKKRAITSFKNRKENKASLVKKQLELFSEIHKSLQNSKIKRYQEQILLEEAEIEATIAQHKIKRNWMTATARGNNKRIKRESFKSPQVLPSSDYDESAEEKKHKSSLENEGQWVFDKLFPSRRFMQRKRSKGKVSPWHSSSPFY